MYTISLTKKRLYTTVTYLILKSISFGYMFYTYAYVKNVLMNDYHSWFELIGQNTFLPRRMNKNHKKE